MNAEEQSLLLTLTKITVIPSVYGIRKDAQGFLKLFIVT